MMLVSYADVSPLLEMTCSAGATQKVLGVCLAGPTVELRWDFPSPAVTLDLWLPFGTSAASAALLQGLTHTARSMSSGSHVRPHWRTMALSAESPPAVLNRFCFRGLPQFCAQPDHGAPGAVLLEEAVRQHCVLSTTSAAVFCVAESTGNVTNDQTIRQ